MVTDCPICIGQGYVGAELCWLCHGAQGLDPEQSCACGLPAVYIHAATKKRYCGRKICEPGQARARYVGPYSSGNYCCGD